MIDTRAKPEEDIEAINQISIVPHLLEVVCSTTGMGFAAIARVTDERWITCRTHDTISFGLKPGDELVLETTICNEIRQSGKLVVIDHVDEDKLFAHHNTPARYGFQSYISVPIITRDGSFFGTLCAIDPKPNRLNRPEIIGMFTLFADLISFHLEAVKKLTDSKASLLKERGAAVLREKFTIELAAANKQMAIANEELAGTQQDLQLVIRRLEESEEKLKQAIETGKMGTWSINPFTLKITLSDFIRNLFGFHQTAEVSVEDVLQQADAEHQQLLRDTLSAAVLNFQASDVEYGITNCVTNEHKWVKSTGRMFFDSSGNAAEYSGIVMDITERKQDDIRKNDFIGMVSHELKTPLTSLNAYIQMLQSKALKNQDLFTANSLEKASWQIKKMNTMINGFLNVSRLESGKIYLNKQQFVLNDLINAVIEETTLTQSTHTVLFNPCDEFILEADREKTGNVLVNLISNAIKYSPQGDTVEITCKKTDNAVQISIKDTGIGIKPEDTEKLFDRFYRVDSQDLQYISGFGIGLYVSAEIIQRHEGEIWVESKFGEGSVFYFTLPCPNPAG